MKVTLRDTQLRFTSSREMQPGQIGRVLDTRENVSQKNDILLRAYDTLVSLRNPRRTWHIAQGYDPDFEVEILPVGAKVELEVE